MRIWPHSICPKALRFLIFIMTNRFAKPEWKTSAKIRVSNFSQEMGNVAIEGDLFKLEIRRIFRL